VWVDSFLSNILLKNGKILLVTASIFVLIGVCILLLNPHANKWIVIICLVLLTICLFLSFIYYLYHTIYDQIHRHRKYISGCRVWIESHNNISIVRNAFYVIFTILIIIGFTDVALCSSGFVFKIKYKWTIKHCLKRYYLNMIEKI
jgi:uncharacterized membrane protein YfcA